MVGYSSCVGTGDATWTLWTTTSSTACSSTIWTDWNNSSCCSTTATSAATTVWYAWVHDGTGSCYTQAGRTCQQPQLSAEELERQVAEQKKIAAEWEAKARKEQAEREAAEKRAEELLIRCLDAEQRKQFRKEKKFKVIGGDGATFELGYTRSGNAREFDADGKPIARFCIHPREDVPIPDVLLAQKLMLETDPASFRKIANKTALV